MPKECDIIQVQGIPAVVTKVHATGEVDLRLLSPGNVTWKKVILPPAPPASTPASVGGGATATKA